MNDDEPICIVRLGVDIQGTDAIASTPVDKLRARADACLADARRRIGPRLAAKKITPRVAALKEKPVMKNENLDPKVAAEMDRSMGLGPANKKPFYKLPDGRFVMHTIRPSDLAKLTIGRPGGAR